jgi:hypothetical protein
LKTAFTIFLALVCSVGISCAQGTFQNLDFASANIPAGTAPGSFVPISAALPGWTGYFGTTQQTSMLYNSLETGSVQLALIGPNSPVPGLIPGNSYTPVLQAGLGINNALTSASIAQTGLIPNGTQSILFTASAPYGAGWSVTIAGENIPVVLDLQQGNYGVYAGNISAFAGQTDELRFTANAGSGPTVNLYLDDIQFSSSPVPEPTTLALGVLSILSFAFCRRRKIS